MKRKKIKKEILIRADNAIFILRISPDHFYEWHKKGLFKLTNNKNGKPCIPYKKFKKIAYSNYVQDASKEAFLNHIERLQKEEENGKSLQFKSKTQEILQRHKKHILILESIHNSYKDQIDIINNESAIVAAYLLNARAINLLQMTCLNLENNFLNSSLFLRLIDETTDLAEYFINAENTQTGKKNLLKWFRENIAPPHSVCRQTNSKIMGKLLGGEIVEVHEETMSDLYRVKSKSIHPTFVETLITLFRPEVENREIISQNFEYGESTNYRELYELTSFFQSNIWSVVQGFLLCFKERMPLTDQDVGTLLSLEKLYNQESDTRP